MIEIAIVTGGGGGLGRELALGLAVAGYGVVVADVDQAAAEAVFHTIEGYAVPAAPVAADITSPAGAERVVTVATSLGGPLIAPMRRRGPRPARLRGVRNRRGDVGRR